jgi:SAM-dependent methyltransferase
LKPYVDQIRGVDVSGGMIEEFNKVAKDSGYSTEQMHGTRGDLLDPEDTTLSGQEFHNFDLAMISMALHHLVDPEAAIKKLTERVTKGGAVVVIDWYPPMDGSEDGVMSGGPGHGTNPEHTHDHGHDHEHGRSHGHDLGHTHGHSHQTDDGQRQHDLIAASKHTVAHKGFAKEKMVELFQAAGCVDIEYSPFKERSKFGSDGSTKQLFIARGRKPE